MPKTAPIVTANEVVGKAGDEWPSSAPDQEAPKPGRSAFWWEARPLPAQRGSRPRIVLVAVVMIGVFSFLMYSVFRDAPREGRQFPLCPHDLSSVQAGTSCTVAWSALRTKVHPTQVSVGYVWALKHKVEKMYSEESAQERMDGKHIPCIKRGSELYFSDGHHTLSALDSSGFWHLAARDAVTIVVLCDLTALSVADFWATMGEKGFAYLYGRPSGPWTSLPEPLAFSALPSLVVFNNHEPPSFTDDPWRALSGASRKISNQKSCKAAASNTKYCMRAYDRVCNAEKGNSSIFFFEYYWAPAALGYFWNAAWLDPSLWETDLTNRSDYDAFAASVASLPQVRPDTPGLSTADIEEAIKLWFDAAEQLVPLSRSFGARNYVLPAGFLERQTLPGHVAGMAPLQEKDPKCGQAAASCDVPTQIRV
ncbi:hypothetical protein EMIHUDRAFT_227039 [Emiliania huxleyi CCMP1516]|uniref:ParB/Sulfiredoxin domain-containing protein n=2 Tax=Emiliania huxleyi TaxID=2903 RepID=A0A0D3KJJ9_EMIH1|nr:hypothetical protein EMIHUDRAFT_227039 [Emiliania huxleyi CCMP1516]EOD35934.1 hypothetical protein EMIHUDRAFT_227039 [Emiliania huxleyi CCMP1516]|eukprot:XP_005788363.1 hypothetical protein EMIHUDRAFT_227039 [Emiliania huxleyi CCMP1516]